MYHKQSPKISAATLLASAILSLTYSRAHAKSSVSAILSFLRAQSNALARLLRIGWKKHIHLAELENACALSGLNYPGSSSKDDPTWVLPTEFVNLPAKSLPPHPLINAPFLSQLAEEARINTAENAVLALQQLLSQEGLTSRWNGIARQNPSSTPVHHEARIAVCLHLYYPDVWPMLRVALEAIPEQWDLYISVPVFACTPTLSQIAKDHPGVRFLPCANRGRDVLPFLRWLELATFDNYDVVCKLHSKRSPHMLDGANWLAEILQCLLGPPEQIATLLERFRSTPKLGMVGPEPLLIDVGHPFHSNRNERALITLRARASLPDDARQSPFFAGTMFWFRPAAISALGRMGLSEKDFPLEMGQTDGTLSHALERLIWPIVENSGFSVDTAYAQSQSARDPIF